MKFKPSLSVSAGLLCISLYASAQRANNSFQARYKELAKEETQTMNNRYRLNKAQLHDVTILNDKYYSDVNAVFNDPKNTTHSIIAGKIASIRSNRELILQKLFTATQYAAYRKDMDFQEARVRERMKRQQEYSRQHPLRINPVKPSS